MTLEAAVKELISIGEKLKKTTEEFEHVNNKICLNLAQSRIELNNLLTEIKQNGLDKN